MKITIRNIANILLISGFSLLILSCSSKQEQQEYNQPALYWYNKMIKQVSYGYVDDADDTFLSLQSEHKNSPLLATSMQIMAKAHISEEEYELANYYLDEYTKKFSLSKNIDYIRYLKIKANFLSFQYQNREQNLIISTIKSINEFVEKYPNSEYIALVNTMNGRLSMAKASLDLEIASLYARLDKPQAALLYTKKVEENWIEPKEIQEVSIPWYRSIFE